jgi:hypothetical protein
MHRVGSTKFWTRVGIGAVGVAVFLFAASIFNPALSSASDDPVPGVMKLTPRQTAEVIDGLLRREHPKHWPSLGMMEGADYLILMYGSPRGPSYTVCSRYGDVLEQDLSADDVYRSFPDLNIPGMRLEPGESGGSTPLMLADPAD